MPLLLNIETATQICSVSLSQNGQLIAFRESRKGLDHATKLTPFIEEVLQEANFSYQDLDAVAVSKGPGSYTGLRIGVSTAKGIAYAQNIPLISVNTLQSLAWQIIHRNKAEMPVDAWLCPMIDARRMEVYSVFFDRSLQAKTDISAEIITENSFAQTLAQRPVYFFGNGAAKCQQVITHANAHFISDISLSSNDMISLSLEAFLNKKFEDTAYFEPFYLKDFIATVPKKNIFGKKPSKTNS